MLSTSEQPVTGANRAKWDNDPTEDGTGPWRSDRGGRKGVKDRSGRQLPHQVSLIHLNGQRWYLSPETCVLISRSSSVGEAMPLWSVWCVFECVSVNLRRWFKSGRFRRKEKTQTGPRARLFVKEKRKKKIRSHALIVSPQQTQTSMQNDCCTHFSLCSFTSGFTLKTENTTTWY